MSLNLSSFVFISLHFSAFLDISLHLFAFLYIFLHFSFDIYILGQFDGAYRRPMDAIFFKGYLSSWLNSRREAGDHKDKN